MNMDIQQHRTFKLSKTKRFTLTAIASAILTLNVNIAKAATCPVVIDSVSTDICTFNAHSSVTVANGGAIGGISMSNYNPSSGQITIDAGGVVKNTSTSTSTAAGITINHSTLSGGLINNGTITSDSGTGILVNSGSTVGSITNNGTISGASYGILVDASTITNGISNSGSIVTATETGIRISNGSHINGGISNTGTITAGDNVEGISILSNNVINGGISNSGTINSDSHGNGIVIHNNNNISGDISNWGTINASGAGIQAGDVNTINNDIHNYGTINAGSIGIDLRSGNSISGSIVNSGVINAGDIGISASAQTISGGISNSGTIIGGTTGISIGSINTISGGITNSGIIQGGTKAIFAIPGSTITGGINIVGTRARLIGAVDAQGTDFNVTSGATFTSEGTFNINNFNIASNAVFNMQNSITAAGTVTNAGTLAIGPTTQTITGNYTQNTGGVLQVSVTSGTSYGQLAVSGNVDLSRSGTIYINVTEGSSIKQGETLSNIISSGGTLTGPTDGYDVSTNSFLWNFTSAPHPMANHLAAGADLTATINSAAYSVCQGDYCQGAANAIINQVAAGNAAFGSFATLPTASAFEAAASESTPELTNENTQAIQLATRAVLDVAPMWGTMHGKSGGDSMQYEPDKVWLKPYGAWMTQHQNNTVDGFTAKAYGVVIGKDVERREDGLVGGAVAVGGDNMSGKDNLNGQSIASTTYQGILYGARKFYNAYLAGQGLVGYGNNDTSRNIFSSTAKGSYNSWFTNLNAELGWNYYSKNQDLVLTPELSASYLFIYQGSYQENGSPLDLAVNSSNNSSLVLGAYGNGAYRLETLKNLQDVTLTGYAGLARNVLNSTPQTGASFVAGGPNFVTYGVQTNHTVFRGGVGLALTNPTKPLSVSFNYDFQLGNNANSNIGSLTIVYKI